MFKTRLDIFGNDFGLFWNFEIFLIFFENFRRLDPPWNTRLTQNMQKKISKKLTQNLFKTRLDTFGNDFGHFCNFENFLIFLKIFEDSTLHGTLGKRTNFGRNFYPETCSKQVWTFLGTILGFFGILKFF